MGEVISISRASDLDIFSEFDAQCPTIPEEVDTAIRACALNAVAPYTSATKPASFRAACGVVVLVSLAALVVVKGLTSRMATTTSVAHYGLSDTAQGEWRKTRESWQAYISQLEKDPVFVHLQREKKLFQQQYP